MTSIFTRKPRHMRHEGVIVEDELQATIDSQESEIEALRKQLQTLKDKYQEAKAQNPSESPPKATDNDGNDALYQKQRIEKLMGVVAEREKQMRDLQNQLQTTALTNQEALLTERKEKHVALNEVEALHAQLSSLKAKFLEVQKRQLAQETENKELLAEKEEVDIKLRQAVQTAEHRDYLENECERMTQVQIDLTLRLDEANATVKSLEDTLRAKEDFIQSKEEQLSLLNDSLEESERKMQALQNERSLLQDNVFRTQSAQEDAEARLKVAHYHLAKKVKETSQLNDRNAELEAQIRECYTDIEESQGKIQDLQKLLEEQLHVERKRQEQLQEALKETEAFALDWEDKYFKVQEKWQEYESRFHEMKKVEEKLQKIHTQWINMGFHFDSE